MKAREKIQINTMYLYILCAVVDCIYVDDQI